MQPALNHLAAILSICSPSSIYLKHLFSTAGSITSIGCPFTAGKIMRAQALRIRNQAIAKPSPNGTASQSGPALAAESQSLLIYYLFIY